MVSPRLKDQGVLNLLCIYRYWFNNGFAFPVLLFQFSYVRAVWVFVCERQRGGDKKEEEEMETVWVTKPHPWLPFPRYVRQLES